MSTPISTQLQENFHLSPEIISFCDKYYILYWQSRYLYTQLLSHSRVVREKIPYLTIFKDGLSLEYLASHPDETVRVSFRRLRGKLSGYVLISSAPQIAQ